MTGLEAKRHLDVYVGVDSEEDLVLLIVNEALNLIGDLAFHTEEHSLFSRVESEWLDLPENTTNIQSVSMDGQQIQNYEIRGLKIRFENSGTYDVVIRTLPPKLEDLEDEIEVHPVFNSAIIAYLRGFYKMMDDDTSQDGARLLAEFKEECIKSFNTLERIRNRR